MSRSFSLVLLATVAAIATMYYVKQRKDNAASERRGDAPQNRALPAPAPPPGSADTRGDAPQNSAPLPRPALSPAPQQLPMIGAAGTDSFGYPRRAPDRAGFLALAYHKQLRQLDKYITSLQAEFETDFRKEFLPILALESVTIADPALTPILDEWVRRSPSSFAAHAARGRHLNRLGWQIRGNGTIDTVPADNHRRFKDYLRRALPDLERAAQLRPRLIATHGALVANYLLLYQPDKARRWLEDSLKRCPECVSTRRVYLGFLEPRWGGSYAAMDAFLATVNPFVARNRRLGQLAATPHTDRCLTARAAKNLDAALRECNRALQIAPDEWRVRYLRAGIYADQKREDLALADLERALAVRPQDVDTLRRRAVVFLMKKQWVNAARDLLTARKIDHTNKTLISRIRHAVDGLRYAGDQAYKANRDRDAIAIFRLGLELLPGDKDLVKRLAFAQARGGLTDLRAEVSAHPNDYELHRQLDYALVVKRQFHEIVQMWTDFIQRNPNEARAYRERGGTYMHLRDRANMSRDVLRACTMGLPDACAIAKRFRLR